MSELDPMVQGLLDGAIAKAEPSASDRARVKSHLLKKAGPGILALAIPTASAAAAAAPVVTGVAVKILAAILVIGAAGGGVYAVRAHTPPMATPPVVVIAPAAPTIPVDVAPPALEPVASITQPPAALASPRRAARPNSPVPAIAPPTTTGTLKDEFPLVSGAHAALAAHDPGKALSLLDTHASRFPQGQLTEERDALRVLAVCALGRGDARSAAESFLKSRPRSTFAPRIREACGLK